MIKRLVGAAVATAGIMVAVAVPASAQEETPPEDINCFPILSSLVCYLPVTIGPFNINVPVDVGSVFPPPEGP